MRLPSEVVVRWLVRLSVAALFAAVSLSFYLTLGLKVVPAAVEPPARARLADEEICAGLVLARLPDGGHDLVRAERVGVRRMRKGPFAFPTREMVVSGLELALPESYFVPPPPPPAQTNAAARAGSGTPSASPANATQVIDALTTGGGRLRDVLPRVAGFRVRGLKIARLEGGTNAVPWLASEGGEAVSSGDALRLGKTWFVTGGKTNTCSEASLVFKPFLRLYPRR